MSFDWSKYLDLAHDLASLGKTHPIREAELRASISRAYYAAFCKSRNFLYDMDNDWFAEDASVHREVQEKFSYSQKKERKQIGQNLSRLRRLRNQADYDDQVHNLVSNSNFALKLAEDIITALKKL